MSHGSRGEFFGGGGSAGPLFEEPARPSMTIEEQRVASVLGRHKGRAQAIARRRLEQVLGLDERQVKAAVEGLREQHDWPIGALRTQGGGYFLVVDEEDARVAFHGYWSQAVAMIRQAKRFAKLLPDSAREEKFRQLRLELE